MNIKALLVKILKDENIQKLLKDFERAFEKGVKRGMEFAKIKINLK